MAIGFDRVSKRFRDGTEAVREFSLDVRDGEFGIESMCAAGGMGQAMLVQRLN